MATITLSIPEEIKIQMEKFEWLNWSAIAREAFQRRIKQLQILNKLEKDFKNSKLSDKECLELGKQLKDSMCQELRDKTQSRS
ncbi:MAG: hypothetical protein AABX11_00090 [Nanoarchaeota archaeon]